MKKLLLILLVFLFAAININAQIGIDEKDLIKEMAIEEEEIIEAIVLYPKDIRTSIFEASTQPQVIIKLANVQEKTSAQFKTLMMKYPMDVQKSVWEMSRYPGLINELAKNPENASQIILNYPKQIQDQAWSIVREQTPLLREAAKLEALSYSSFSRIIAQLPYKSKLVFEELIKYPEVLGLLNENIEFTILGGDLYKQYPEWAHHYADSLHLVVAREQAIELENWKSKLENDPQAIEELKQASQEFAGEYGYDNNGDVQEENQEVVDDLYYTDEKYNYDEEEYDYDEGDFRRVERHYYYHYPYWFGYPYWHTYPHWRPYPFWYEWGFYWNSHGGFYVYHMPSHFFMNWYFHHPRHHYHYAHLSHHFVNHYYGHRTSRSSISGTVHTWRNDNRNVISDDWVAINKTDRINTLKEYGRMEKARTSYNETNPKNPVSKKDYIQKNKDRYPTLERRIDPKEKPKTKVTKPAKEKVTPQKPRTQPVPQKPKVKPVPQKPKAKPVPQKPAKRPKPDIRVQPSPKKPKASPKPKTKVFPVPNKPTRRKTNKTIELKKAGDYHKQSWKAPKTKTRVYKKPAVKPKAPTVKRKPVNKPRKPN